VSTNSYDRLPGNVIPLGYELELRPDLDAEEFSGTLIVHAAVRSVTDCVFLNVCHLDVESGELLHPKQGCGAPSTLAPTVVAPEVLRLDFGRTLLPGAVDFLIRYRGSMKHSLVGLYLQPVEGPDGAVSKVIVSHCSPTHARKIFPCWDEPAFKATLALSVVLPDHMVAVSNAAVQSIDAVEGGLRRWHFEPSARLPAHLLALVAGDLDLSDTVVSEETQIRFVGPHGQVDFSRFGLDVALFAVQYLSQYFDCPCPAQKLDLVALPGFPRAAMENFGCIIFNDAMLAIDPDRATRAETAAVVTTIVHEISHMWFGNLVTIQWWDAVWLVEAFATFLEVKGAHAYDEALGGWDEFRHSCGEALELDATHSTRPLTYEVRVPQEAGEMYDALTYQKGAAVIHMIEVFIGEVAFRTGVATYLRSHAGGNATPDDFWSALEHASGQPVIAMARSWTEAPGFPAVLVEKRAEGLQVRQTRFTYAKAGTSAGRWLIPLFVRATNGSADITRRLLGQPADIVAIPDETRFRTVNANAVGFYRVLYDAELLRRLDDECFAALSPIECYSLVDDAWAGAVAGLVPAQAFVQIAEACTHVSSSIVWDRILSVLSEVQLLLPEAARVSLRDRWSDQARDLLAGLEQPLPITDTELARVLLLGFGELGVPRVLDWAHTLVAAGSLKQRAYSELHVPAMHVWCTHGGDSAVDHLVSLLETASTPQERRRYAVMFARPHDVVVFARSLETGMRLASPEYLPFMLREALRNKARAAEAFAMIRVSWPDIVKRCPPNELVRIFEGIGGISDPHLARALDAFLSEVSVPMTGKVIDQSRERMWAYVAFAEREAPALSVAFLGSEDQP
jgi:puromycin-sensitive aminopeptidase